MIGTRQHGMDSYMCCAIREKTSDSITITTTCCGSGASGPALKDIVLIIYVT